MKQQKSQKEISRRRFLTTAAAFGTGVVLAPKIMTQTPSSGDILNLAVIGTGEQGQLLLESCLKIPGIEIAAICDIWTDYNLGRATRLLMNSGRQAMTYGDYREMLEEEKFLDAVIVASPDFCHAEQTVACLKAGLHVYCETPMSNRLEGARRMVQAAKESGKLLQIGLQRRSNPRYIHCGERLLGEVKLLGKITAINGQWNREVQSNRGWPRRAPLDEATLKKHEFESMQQFRNWRWYKGSGSGPLVEFGTHQVDVFNWYLGALPRCVTASGGTDYYDRKTHQFFDTAMVVYEYETRRGAVRAFYQSVNSNSSYGNFERFLGDEGTLQISETAENSGIYRESTAPRWKKWVDLGLLAEPETEEEEDESEDTLEGSDSIQPPCYNLPFKFDEPEHKPHLENFFDAIRGKVPLNCPGEIGYETAVTVFKAIEAAEAREKLILNPKDFQV